MRFICHSNILDKKLSKRKAKNKLKFIIFVFVIEFDRTCLQLILQSHENKISNLMDFMTFSNYEPPLRTEC